MLRVIKYEIPNGEKVVIEIVPPARILSIGIESGIIYLYALSDPMQGAYPKKVQVVRIRTGDKIESKDAVGFVGTVNPPTGSVISFFAREL